MNVLAIIVLITVYLLMGSNANSVNNTTVEGNKIDVNEVLISLQYKLDTFTTQLSQMDATLQSLQEKSHTWVIFRHHINAWNGQMQSVEQKLEAIYRWQNSQGSKNEIKSSLEFTLDQILNKVALMTNTCQSNKIIRESNMQELLNERESLIQDYEKATGAFNKSQLEAIVRMNNILRHVNNVDHKPKKSNKQGDVSKNENSKGSKGLNLKMVGVKKNLNNCENNKLMTMTNVTQRDVRQLNEQTRKNTRNLDSLTKTLGIIEEKLSVWHDNAENNVNYMTKQCQSASKELSTFSESSDLLLKRIEFLVHDVDQKLYSVDWNLSEVDKNSTTDMKNIQEQQEEQEQEEEEHEEIEYDMTMTEMPTEREENAFLTKLDVVQDTTNDGKNSVVFIQPHILGCHELNHHNQRIDGIYKFQSPHINEGGRDFNERLCIFGEKGPAWTVIQNRGPYVEQESFNRSWSAYRAGFGDLHKDFWFGNEFIHKLVYPNDYELRIEMVNFNNEMVWAEYKVFRIESEAYNYKLLIGEYQGTAGDAMKYHNNMDFSTYDSRNDRSVDACCSCALGYGSGWWFNNCSEANLNGIYQVTPTGHNYVGIIWELWLDDHSLYKTRMMIRPISAENPIDGNNKFAEDP